ARLNIPMIPIETVIEEVTVTTEKADKNTKSTDLGKVELTIEKVKSLPAFLGEVDVLKTIQLLPGVLAAGEGNSGFYVRGGGPDQNLVLLDEAPVYNASHLFGFFSVFNADAVSGLDLYKGSMPAQYGGRLASVLDISMKEGNNQKYKVDGGIGVISSRLTVQGPLKKDTSAFIISARRTYIDVLMKPFIKKDSPFAGSAYYFYDLNAKVNYKFTDKDRLFLSGYFGKDVFTFNNTQDDFLMRIPWGNATATARWNHLFNDKLFMNVTGLFSKYDFKFEGEQDQFKFGLRSGILDYSGKVDFQYFPSLRHNVRFGAYYVHHRFIPSSATASSGETEFDVGGTVKLFAHEAAVYVGDDFDITDMLRVNIGVRYSFFNHVGPFTRYVKDPTTGKNSDTLEYAQGQNVALYHGPEPRFSIRYSLTQNASVKAGFTRNLQFIHLASLSTVSLPTDVWIPSTDRVKPQLGYQYSVGYFQNFKDNMYETSVEVYYKQMKNQVEYREGALPDDDVKDNIDNNFVFGNGWSYGAEFFVKKRTGQFNGWVGYTLAWTKRKFPDINFGEVYYAKFDRRHDLSVALTYDPTKKITLGLVFIYATGNAITLPVSWYIIDNRITYEYGQRNSLRMRPYHRMDLSVTLKGKETKKFKSSWNFSVYNVYSRLNPYFLYIDSSGDPYDGTLTIKAKQVSLFPILPSVTWNFNF
ncbi:MAG TPA: TonB-dependent receptor plug domain-containing protein, partial [Flavobacteriales bacterium]|nr:TonB-dependent receptor plug domain-containing protein [Flavobacteriales bacterium]